MKVAGWWTIAFGGVLAVIGLNVMYSEPQIVGGDAYNYIIGAVRGVGWIAAGGVCAVIGAAFLVMAPKTIPESDEAVSVSPSVAAEGVTRA